MSSSAIHVDIPAAGAVLAGELQIPDGATGVVLFAHSSGSSRHSPRNALVAQRLRAARLGTLLFDLLTAAEEHEDLATHRYRLDIELLASRLVAAAEWVAACPDTPKALGLFGASTGAAAAIVAATRLPDLVRAVVSRGGRPDLAGADLVRVRAPVLLLVGGGDTTVLDLNRCAVYALQDCETELAVIPHATHLFLEPSALEDVASRAADWFARYCTDTPRNTHLDDHNSSKGE